MENKKKSYVSTQLCCVLNPIALKTLLYITLWQNSPKGLLLYVHSFSRALKMDEELVRRAIQTLINARLIRLEKDGDKTRIELIPETFDKAIQIPLERIYEKGEVPLAEDVTYDKQVETQKQKDISSMSDSELRTLLLRVQASLNEREQLREIVKTNELPNDCDSLPF